MNIALEMLANMEGSRPVNFHVATGSMDGTARIWDLRKPGSMLQILEHTRNKSVTSVEWNRSGSQLATGSSDKKVRIWSPSESH